MTYITIDRKVDLVQRSCMKDYITAELETGLPVLQISQAEYDTRSTCYRPYENIDRDKCLIQKHLAVHDWVFGVWFPEVYNNR